jgi:large subunit ribosomal protein L21
MYAVIASGGKQERVAEGQRLRVELLGVDAGTEVTLRPVLIVDGDRVLSTPADLAKASVTATVVGEEKGKKINAMTYKNKTNQSRRWGHRQHYSTIEITSIAAG